jgi:GcrA cell cycle regulator
MATPWTDDKIELLKTLWPQTHISSTKIAEKLGFSKRSAVIAKAGRLGLPLRNGKRPARYVAQRTAFYVGPKAIKSGSAVNKIAADAPPVQPSAPVVQIHPEPSGDDPECAGVRFEDLQSHHCRWPIGDPHDEDFGFCGCQKALGAPYCDHHAAIAYNAWRPKGPSCYRIGA